MDPEVVAMVVASALFLIVVWLVSFTAGQTWFRPNHPEPFAWWRRVLPPFVGTGRVLLGSTLLGVAAIATMPFLGGGFLPEFREGVLQVALALACGVAVR